MSKYSDAGDHWYTGTYDEESGEFTPFDLEDRRYDTNDKFYASKTFLDTRDDPRRVLWGWLISPGIDSGSIGTQSAPRVVEADPNDPNLLVTYPIPELHRLRNEDTHVSLSDVSSTGEYVPALPSEAS